MTRAWSAIACALTLIPLAMPFVPLAEACETGIEEITNSSPADGSAGHSASVTASWALQRNGGCPTARYQYTVFYGTVNPPSSQKCAGTTSLSCSLTGLAAGRTYFWFVEGVSQWSDVIRGPTWSFSTNSPPNTPGSPSPAGGATNVPRTVTLGWSGGDPDAGDSVTYVVTFDGVTRCNAISSTTCSVPGPLGYGSTHTWRVTATDSRGATSTNAWSFTVTPNTIPSAPSAPNPGDRTTGVSTTPTLAWTGSTDADGDAVTYDVRFNQGDTPVTVICARVTTTSCTPSTRLSAMTVYAWSVTALDPAGNSRVGGPWLFQTTNAAPAVPSAPSPSDGAVDVAANPTVTLTWQTSDPDPGDVVTSTVVLGTSSGSMTERCRTTATSCTVTLAGNTPYFWQVTAADPNGGQSQASWSFTTANHPPATPSGPSPAHGATNLGPTATLTWTSSDSDASDTLTYTVKLNPGTGTPTSVVCSGASASCGVTLAPSTTYSWSVDANDGHVTVTGGPWRFTTTSDAAPSACFTHGASSSNRLILDFDGACSTAKFGSIASYQWSFGDGQTASGSAPTHMYACPGGSPVVQLTVTDTFGNSGATSRSVSSVDVDADGDGLYKCQEAQQGTADDNVDTVGDGIGDFTRSQWNPERDAIFCNAARTACSYPTTDRRNLYLHVDVMSGHSLSAAEKQTTLDAYDAAGIRAVIDDGDYGGGNVLPDTQYSSMSDYQQWRNLHFPANREGVFHYVVFACLSRDDIYGASMTWGIASTPGDAVMVFDCATNMGDQHAQAKEILHEVGHNLLGFHVANPANCAHIDMVTSRSNPEATSLNAVGDAKRCQRTSTNPDFYAHASASNDPMISGGPTKKTSTTYPATTANALRLDWAVTTFAGEYDCLPLLGDLVVLPVELVDMCAGDGVAPPEPDAIHAHDLDPLLAPIVTGATGGNRSATITWQAPVTTDAIRGYLVYRNGLRVASGGCAGLVAATSCTDAGLDDHASYAYTVQGVFASSNGAWSAPAIVTTVTPPSAPVLAIKPGAYEAMLSWAMPAGSANPDDALVTGYEVYRASQPTSEGTLLAQVSGTTYADPAISPGELAYYRVRAVSPGGPGAPSQQVSITLSGPALFAVGSGSACSNGWYCGSTPVTLNVQAAAARQASGYPGVGSATVYEDLVEKGRLHYLDEAESADGWTPGSINPSTLPQLSTDASTRTQAYGALTIRVTNDPTIPIDTAPTVTKVFSSPVDLTGDDAVGMDVYFVSTNGQTRPIDVQVLGTVNGAAASVSATKTLAYGAWTPVTVAPLPAGFTATSIKLTLHEFAKSIGSTSAPVQVVTVDGLRGFNRAALTETTDGVHHWTLRVVDGAGRQQWVGGPTIRLDRVAPLTTAGVDGLVSESPSWYQAAATVTLAASDLTSGVATTYYTVNAGATQTYAGAFQTPATSGVHTIRSWSVDKAGNVEATRVLSVNVDVTPPTVARTFVNGGQTIAGHNDPDGVTWIPAGTQVRLAGADVGSGVASVCYAYDADLYTCVPQATVTLNPAREGPQALRYYSVDTAGYRSPTGVGRFAYDAQAPVIDARSPTGTNAPIASVVRLDFHDPGTSPSGIDVSTMSFRIELVTGTGSLTQYTDVTSQGATVKNAGNLTWTPSTTLAPSQTYRVTFGVSDHATNRVALVWSFQTGVA